MNERFCDFHTHSTRSDGEYSRDDVIKIAIKNNISVLAITDHNISFDDMEFLQNKYSSKIKLINGTEVSTAYTVPDTDEIQEIHIVALDFENTERFIRLLENNRFNSKKYINSIIKKLQDVGIPVNFTYEDLKKESDCEFIGRMTLARKLVSLELIPNISTVFDLYIGDFGERQAYVKSDVSRYIPLKNAVREIVDANGIPVLAHPYSYNFSEQQVRELIRYFRYECGGIAMETHYAVYSQEQEQKLQNYAKQFGLLESAASDFHGSFQGQGKKYKLGQYPLEIYDQLMSVKRQ